MSAGLDAVFGPAAPTGSGIDVYPRRAKVDARREILEFRPFRSPDIIVVIGTFFLAVTEAEGPYLVFFWIRAAGLKPFFVVKA